MHAVCGSDRLPLSLSGAAASDAPMEIKVSCIRGRRLRLHTKLGLHGICFLENRMQFLMDHLKTQIAMPGICELYKTLRLGHWQIRILELLPGSFAEPIRTRLHLADLLDGPEIRLVGGKQPSSYTALSYCWGGEDDTIWCNGLVHKINLGALQALRRLREACCDYKYVWIDAICIDQHNFEEKAQQVPKMLKIYSKADKVVVWLGEDQDPLGNILCVLEHQLDAALETLLRQNPDILEQMEHSHISSGGSGATNTTPETLIRAMNQLLDLPWFGRVWTKQEVWGAREVVLWYKDKSCHWDRFRVDGFERAVRASTGAYAHATNALHSLPAVTQKMRHVLAQHRRADVSSLAVAQSDRAYDQPNPGLLDENDHELDLINVIRRCAGCKCTQPQDHVYGVTGMSRVNIYEHDKDDKKHETLAVNYSCLLEPSATFEDLATYFIGRDNCFSILFLENAYEPRPCNAQFPNLQLSSWVPDWRFHYGDLDWLRSIMPNPLSMERSSVVQMAHHDPLSLPLNLSHRPLLLLTGFKIGRFARETEETTSSDSGFRDFNLPRSMKFVQFDMNYANTLGSMKSWPKDTISAREDWTRTSLRINACAPKTAQDGDLVLAVHGAYALILVRESVRESVECLTRRVYSYVGPIVFAARDPSKDTVIPQGYSMNRRISELLANPTTRFETFSLV